jgi:CubicO group peptidase (beta-lactamase class C family)
MRTLYASLAVVLLVPAAPAAEGIDTRAIDAIVREGLDSWKVPGAALAIVCDDRIIHLQGYGVCRAGGEERVSPDTLFAIASCTKAFTAATVGALADEGRMAWDDPVRKHLPWFRLQDPLADRDVTIRDLLCHRTGLSRHDILSFGTDLSREEIVRRMGLVRPAHSFRSQFEYNNNMYTAAGLAVGAASKSSWEDAVAKRLFEQVGMKRATCGAAAAARMPDRASPHRRKKDGTVEAIPWHDVLDNAGPAGSIHASAHDMARWVRFQLGDGTLDGRRVLKKETLEETHTPQMVIRLEGRPKTAYPDTTQLAYGLGWFVHDHRGHLMYSHTGGLEGFRARTVLVPKSRLGLVLLMNSGVGDSYASMHYVVTNRLLDLLLHLEPKDWEKHYSAAAKKLAEEPARKPHPGTKPSHELKAYAGRYTDEAYPAATVSLRDGELFLEWGRSRIKLEHFHYDTFKATDGTTDGRDPLEGDLAQFQLGPDGDVATLKLLGREFKRSGK